MDTKKVGASGLTQLNNQNIVRGSGLVDADKEAIKLKKADEKSDFNVSVSERAKDIAEARARALEIAKNTPDVREDRVRELKDRIARGEYQVDSGKIADGMLREAIMDELAKHPV